jgi:hypothetical protein
MGNIDDRAISCLGTGTSITNGGVKLVLMSYSLANKMSTPSIPSFPKCPFGVLEK